MNARLTFRSLLTTTSMAALLAASNGARADVVYDNSGQIDQIYITSSVPYVSNSGEIANEYGEDGIEIHGTTVSGGIANSGSINVNDVEEGDDELHGILVDDSDIWGDIENSGSIAVTASGSGNGEASRYAAGIEFGDGSTFSYGGDVRNSGSIDVNAVVANVDTDSDEDTVSQDASTQAYGIRFDNTSSTGNGSIENSGSIDVRAAAKVDQSASDETEDGAYAEATGNAGAHAAGIDARNDGEVDSDHRGPSIADGLNLYSYDGEDGIDVDATAQSFSDVVATANCSTTGESCYGSHYAEGDVLDTASAQAYGVTLGGNAATIGGVYNDATIDAYALAETHSKAEASSSLDAARAYAGYREDEYDDEEYEYYEASRAGASATGLSLDVLQVNGDIENDEDIYAHVLAKGKSTATASAPDYAEAVAGSETWAQARGIAVDTLLVSGDFTNSAQSIGFAKSRADNKATTISDGDADAWAYSGANAMAAGIDLQADALGGTFSNGNDDEEYDYDYEDGLVQGSAVAQALASAVTTGGEYSSAFATGDASATAYGIKSDVRAIAGHFINEGSVDAKSHATGELTARISGGESLDAGAMGEYIAAQATGIDVSGETLAGGFYNDGEVTSKALAEGVSTATADGLDDVLAAAANSATAQARGISIDESEIQDSVLNDGTIKTVAKADVTQNATATASEEGEGDAAALAGEWEDYGEGSVASAYATGLYIAAGGIGGNVVNTDEITVDAKANVASIVAATAANEGDAWTLATGQAYAEGYGIRARAEEVGFGSPVDEDSYYDNGDFVNEGYVDVGVAVNIAETATSISDDGDAGAAAFLAQNYYNYCYSDCGPDANAVAHGIALGGNEGSVYLDGDFLNYSDVNAAATSIAMLGASATVDDGNDTAAMAMAGGGLWSSSYGVTLEDVDAEGEFYNDATITATARTTVNANAFADSDDGPAFAMVGSSFPSEYEPGFGDANYARANATGVLVDGGDLYEGFWNDGLIAGASFAHANAAGEAQGDEMASVFARNSAGAQAVGVELSDAWLGDDMNNQGTIAGLAAAFVETSALADGDIAEAYIGEANDLARASATATGLSASGYYGATVYNGYDEYDVYEYDEEEHDDSEGGTIIALAGALGDNSAKATGQTTAIAKANNAEYASAIGHSGQEGGSYSGSFINDGLVAAGALAYGQEEAEATASSGHGTATAHAIDYAEADAVGIRMGAYEISNYGQIFAGALAISDARATAEGDTAQALADASASAAATGISMYGMGGGYLYNSDAVAAYAYARAHGQAEIDYEEEEDSWAETNVNATAHAIGVTISSGSLLSEIHNSEDGVISATADAAATIGEIEDEQYGNAYAYATGLYVDNASVGSILNDGEISADANARDQARAYAVHIDGAYDTFSGTLTNTGTISAEATSENPYATAILVSDGALVSTISNSGDISAKIEDTSEFDLFGMGGPQTVAIDIRGAGSSVGIQLLKGSILGDILTDNEDGDVIDWSGGTVDGNITGNNGEDGDTLNVFAGEDDEFTYGDTIDGLAAFNVNGGDHSDAVALRLTNVVQNVDKFRAGPNATVTFGTGANVSTGSLDLDASATLAFELTSDGVNGVVNATDADLGGATVKAVFLDAGLPVSQTYRIINWDGSDTQFGSVVSNSLLEKIVAQYGEDGVDLLATRLSFADIAGLKDDATSFGKALDRVFDGIDPDSELGEAIYQLILLTPEEYADAMNEIAGQQTADMQSVTFSQAGSLIHVIQTQLSELRGGTVASADARSLGIRVASNQVMASMSDAPQPGFGDAGTALSGDWSAWARVFGDWAELDRSSVAAGFTSTTGGVVAGADYRFTPNLLGGLAAGYQSSDMDFRGTGEGDISSWSLTAYGDYQIGAIYIDALAGYATQSYDMDRYLTVLGTSYVANSDYDGSSIIGSVETGYEIAFGGGVKVTPFAGVNFTRTETDAVTETGAGVWDLAYDERSENGIDSVLGTRLSKSFVTEGGTKITPTVELGWKHAFGDASPVANAALAGTPGSNFQIFGSEVARDTAIVGAALSVQMTDTIDAYVQYNGQFSSNYMDNTASLRLRWKF
jgi:outer membrane autotransporter protein